LSQVIKTPLEAFLTITADEARFFVYHTHWRRLTKLTTCSFTDYPLYFYSWQQFMAFFNRASSGCWTWV